MKERTTYICEYCHQEFLDKKSAEKCEAFHEKGLAIIQCNYEKTRFPIMNDSESFPATILMENANRRRVLYKRVK